MLSEALVTGIDTRCSTNNATPMASGAKPAGAFFDVAPTMTIRNSAVITTSMMNADIIVKPFAPP